MKAIKFIIEALREPACLYDTYWVAGIKYLFTSFALDAIKERVNNY